MKAIVQTRLMFLKKQWISLLFWLTFPIFTTIGVITLTAAIQEETNIPIGIVLEEKTPLSEQLYESIKETAHIRPHLLNEREAINKVMKHELDSVFIVRKGYEEHIRKGSRNQLIKSYESDLSFAYVPLKETIISYVQQDFSRSRAAYVIQDLQDTYNANWEWSLSDLVERSKEIEAEQNLLQTTLTFETGDKMVEQNDLYLIKPWNIWALVTFLATFLIFDWVIKENRHSILPRFPFGKVSFKNYLVLNGLIYSVLFVIVDILTVYLFSILFEGAVTVALILSVVCFRITINILAFLLSLVFKTVYLFYVTSFAMFLVTTLGSGAIIPIDGLTKRYPWVNYFNPLEPFLSMGYVSYWFILGFGIMVFWVLRKGEPVA